MNAFDKRKNAGGEGGGETDKTTKQRAAPRRGDSDGPPIRLGVRAIFYVIYSSVVWSGVGEVGRFFFAERLAGSDFSAVQEAFYFIAISSVFGGLTTFASARYWRRIKRVGLEEAFCGIVGRTGVPAVALLCVAALCEPTTRRIVLTEAIAGYFLTAPVALAATFPPKNNGK